VALQLRSDHGEHRRFVAFLDLFNIRDQRIRVGKLVRRKGDPPAGWSCAMS
jgi:hypothetical protein